NEAPKIIEKIQYFIETHLKEREADGVLIWFSGYIDSTIITKLSLEAIGTEKVKLFLRDDKFTDGYEDILSNSIEFLGIDEDSIEKCDVEQIIRKFGADEIIRGSIREIPSLYGPFSYSLLKSTAKNEIEGKTYGMVGKASSGREELIHKIIANNKLRSRVQMAHSYLIAEIENRLLVGTINKTELLTGLFTKWGRGHCTDLMPLGNLFRSQILQLADYLKVPESISDLAKADLLPGIDNKYLYFFDLSAFDVDRILFRLESGNSITEISNETGLPIDKIEKVNFFFCSSAYTRAAPLIPKV
ncbi:MAG: NAD(+) synthase, partial [Candidatus Hodarchaeota archaeon]